MEKAKESLEVKRKTLERLTDANLYPYTKFYLRDIKKRFNQYWKNHFSTIGLIGMNEAALNLIGTDIGSAEGKQFAERTLDYMRDTLVEFQKETGNNYNLEATPAEGTTYRLAQIDKKSYVIIGEVKEKSEEHFVEVIYKDKIDQISQTYLEEEEAIKKRMEQAKILGWRSCQKRSFALLKLRLCFAWSRSRAGVFVACFTRKM
jgi:anaerobic ribonucleoside-triphosphate reductase